MLLPIYFYHRFSGYDNMLVLDASFKMSCPANPIIG